MKVFLILIISGVIISFGISLFSDGNFLLNFIDYLFYYGLFILTVGVFLYVSGKGFFDFFRWSSKKVFYSYDKSYNYYKSSDEASPLELDFSKSMLLAGGVSILFTYIIATAMF